jgi:N-acetylneuraminic acid mutarotase
MKRINIALLSLMLLGLLFSCSKASLNYTQDGNWVSRAIFKGVPMGNAACFTIGDTAAFVGTGVNPQDPNKRLATMFKYVTTPIPTNTPTGYDSAYGSWTQVADFIGGGRSQAVGFTAQCAGYLGSGTADSRNIPLADFYRYDPIPNTWTQVASLGIGTDSFPRFDAVAFSMDSVGYVLTGTDNLYYFGDVWKYSPATNTWTQGGDMPGSKRKQAVAWVYKGVGYLLSGFTPGSQWSLGNTCYDFWKFDPNATNGNQWIRLYDIANTNPGTFDDGYTNIVRYHAVGFVITGTATGDKGYITTGTNGSVNNFTWEYDFVTGLWTEKTPFEGAAREGAVGFALKNRGFVATGISGGTAYDDCREFFPNQVYNQYD